MNSQTTIFAADDPFAGRQRYQRVKPALALIGVGRSKLYSLIRSGRIRAVRLDGATFVDLASVAALFAQCPEITPERHIHTWDAGALGFDDGKPRDFGLGPADLAGMAPDDSETALGESGPLPGASMPVAQGNSQVASAEAVSTNAPSPGFLKVP